MTTCPNLTVEMWKSEEQGARKGTGMRRGRDGRREVRTGREKERIKGEGSEGERRKEKRIREAREERGRGGTAKEDIDGRRGKGRVHLEKQKIAKNAHLTNL